MAEYPGKEGGENGTERNSMEGGPYVRIMGGAREAAEDDIEIGGVGTTGLAALAFSSWPGLRRQDLRQAGPWGGEGMGARHLISREFIRYL